jgi:hypothetical protein
MFWYSFKTTTGFKANLIANSKQEAINQALQYGQLVYCNNVGRVS